MTLDQLSAAATQGEWISIQSSINPDRHYITNDHHAIFVSEIGGTRPADLKFVTSLVNLYRTGQLVAAQNVPVLLDALKACRAQFDFYAAEHRKAEKHEKARTNEKFAFICSEAIAQAALAAKGTGDE